MEIKAVKNKLAVAWLVMAVTMSAISSTTFIAPSLVNDGRTSLIINMEIGPELLLFMTITYCWIPLVTVVLSVALKDSANRWSNMITGVGYVFFIIIELILNIMMVAYFFGVPTGLSVIVIALLIALICKGTTERLAFED